MSNDEDPVEYEKIHNAGHGAEHGEEGEGPWLMSFADMVTLLMCFFIIFFQTDQGNLKLEDPARLLERLEELQKILGIEKDTPVESLNPESIRTASGSQGAIDNFKKTMRSVSKNLDLVFSIGSPQPGEIELTFLNTRFFRSGAAELTPKGKKMVGTIAERLKRVAGDAVIEVEGHTDSDPIDSWRFPSNWELSGSRAATVVKVLAGSGLNASHMRATGRAHFDPLVPEYDPSGRKIRENQALNRRIVIRLIHERFKDTEDPTLPQTPERRPRK